MASAGCQPAVTGTMDVVILPVSSHDNNASVRVASNLFPARLKLLD